MEKKNNGILVGILIGLIVATIIVGVLFVTGNINFKSTKAPKNEPQTSESQDNTEKQDKIINNLTVVVDETSGNEVTTKTISTTDGDETLSVSSKEIKLGNKQILKLDEGMEFLKQVSVYDNLIITEQSISLGCSMIIYDFSGNVLKSITLFKDEQGRTFNVYPRYSETEYFNVSTDGTISFLGTKHIQGVANTYINDSGNTIDLCTQGENINDNEIVSGIFKMKYLGNNSFSNITYVNTKATIKDIKSCN